MLGRTWRAMRERKMAGNEGGVDGATRLSEVFVDVDVRCRWCCRV